MTIRGRLTAWYGGALAVLLLVVTIASYQEFQEQSHHRAADEDESALGQAGEIALHVGLPALLLGLAGGWWLTRRALRPLSDLTAAAQGIDEANLLRPLPRSRNGDELDQLAGVLNAMQARLHDSFARIREFTLHASHELKTPLTVMYNELETSLQDPHLDARTREHTLSQLDEVGRLSKIVDGLSILTRADAGQIRLESVEVALDVLVRDLHEDLVILAEPSGITVELTACEPLRVAGDAHRLRQLLLNLADNAVKYNHAGGRITVALRRAGDSAECVIANTGPGIPAHLLPRVFDRFFRGDEAHGSEVEGCGLGLSIARWIAQAHGGDVAMTSELSNLTTATVRLPLWKGEARTSMAALVKKNRGTAVAATVALFSLLGAFTSPAAEFHTFLVKQDPTVAAYDEAMAAASLQGIINRTGPEVYLLSSTNDRPAYWLNVMSRDGRWLAGKKHKPLRNLNALVKLAGKRVKGAVIWDPEVPATVNVATTFAGVRDAVVLSPELASHSLARWRLPVLADFRGKFTGAETGSKKNDAYRWAIREFLAKGLCSAHRLCLYEDAFSTRKRGDANYVVTRDWAVNNRAFVFDLSPWGDEAPGDEPQQRPGLDLETYRMILTETQRQAGGREMTEMTGFFALAKYSRTEDHASAHQDVPTEWESVALITPYNVYQNTISSDCLNESFHRYAARPPLHQRSVLQPRPLERKVYVCVLMADYDSATPFYSFLPKYWGDRNRGNLPLAWGIDPTLVETYPDLMSYYYETASPNDTVCSDASAAGYMNPDLIAPASMPLFLQHNQKFFREMDMTMAPMVLDVDQPSPAVKDAFSQFAPDGFATLIVSAFGSHGSTPRPQVWKGMPIMELLNDTCNSKGSAEIAGVMANVIRGRGAAQPGFYFFRTVWIGPSTVMEAVKRLQADHPEFNAELLGPREFFSLYKESLNPPPRKPQE
jgi:signal transduction histidine kinase